MQGKEPFALTASGVPVRVGDVVLITRGTTQDIENRECFRHMSRDNNKTAFPLSSPYYFKRGDGKCDTEYNSDCVIYEAGDFDASCLYVVTAVPTRYWGPGGKRGIVKPARAGDVALPHQGDPYEGPGFASITCSDVEIMGKQAEQFSIQKGKACRYPQELGQACSFFGDEFEADGWSTCEPVASYEGAGQFASTTCQQPGQYDCQTYLNAAGKSEVSRAEGLASAQFLSVGLVPLLTPGGTPNYDLRSNKLIYTSAALAVEHNGPGDSKMEMVVNHDDPRWNQSNQQPLTPFGQNAAWLASKSGTYDGWLEAAQLSFLHADPDNSGPCCYGDPVSLRLASGKVAKGGDIMSNTAELNTVWSDPEIQSQFYGGTQGPFTRAKPYPSSYLGGAPWRSHSEMDALSFVHVGMLFDLVTNTQLAPQQRIARNILACMVSSEQAETQECISVISTAKGCGQGNDAVVQCDQPSGAGIVHLRDAVYNFCNKNGQKNMKTGLCQISANQFVDKKRYGKLNRSVQLYCKNSVAAAKGDPSKVDKFCGCYWPYIRLTKAYQALQRGPLRQYRDLIDNQNPACIWNSCNLGEMFENGASPYNFVNQMDLKCTPLNMCVNSVDIDGPTKKVIMKDLKFTNNCTAEDDSDKNSGDKSKDGGDDTSRRDESKDVVTWYEKHKAEIRIGLAVVAVAIVIAFVVAVARKKA